MKCMQSARKFEELFAEVTEFLEEGVRVVLVTALRGNLRSVKKVSQGGINVKLVAEASEILCAMDPLESSVGSHVGPVQYGGRYFGGQFGWVCRERFNGTRERA